MVFAYLDPNIGTVVVQTVVAAAITIPIVLRTQVGAVIARLRGQRASEDGAADPDEQQSRD
jgi:hypothetical protein